MSVAGWGGSVGPVADDQPSIAQVQAGLLGLGTGHAFQLLGREVGVLRAGQADLSAPVIGPVASAVGGAHSGVSLVGMDILPLCPCLSTPPVERSVPLPALPLMSGVRWGGDEERARQSACAQA